MHKVAMANDVVEQANAPFTPSRLMDKNTDTTIRFSGIPNKFIITDRWLSGMYFDRSVPISGKYIPTHISNVKNAAARLIMLVQVTDAVATPIAVAATANMPALVVSMRTPLL